MNESITIEQRVDAANAKVLEIMTRGHPVWVDVQPAFNVIPGMTKTTILTPGSGITPDRLTPPQRTSICGAAIHELAKTREEVWAMVERGEIQLASSWTRRPTMPMRQLFLPRIPRLPCG